MIRLCNQLHLARLTSLNTMTHHPNPSLLWYPQKSRFKNIGKWLTNTDLNMDFNYDHIRLVPPEPVWSPKLSNRWFSQYCGGGPHGNTGCCSFFLFILLMPPKHFFCSIDSTRRELSIGTSFVLLSLKLTYFLYGSMRWSAFSKIQVGMQLCEE